MDKQRTMNINESCLLNFLLNPEEINVMTGIFQQNIREIENKFQQQKNISQSNDLIVK